MNVGYSQHRYIQGLEKSLMYGSLNLSFIYTNKIHMSQSFHIRKLKFHLLKIVSQ